MEKIELHATVNRALLEWHNIAIVRWTVTPLLLNDTAKNCSFFWKISALRAEMISRLHFANPFIHNGGIFRCQGRQFFNSIAKEFPSWVNKVCSPYFTWIFRRLKSEFAIYNDFSWLWLIDVCVYFTSHNVLVGFWKAIQRRFENQDKFAFLILYFPRLCIWILKTLGSDVATCNNVLSWALSFSFSFSFNSNSFKF